MRFRTFDDLTKVILQNTKKKRCVVVGAEATHALEAIVEASSKHIVEPILCGNKSIIENKIKELGENVTSYSVIDCATPNDSALTAIKLVKEGRAELIMKGQIETSTLMNHLLDKQTGLRTDCVVHSLGFAEIETYHKLLVTTDAAILISPTLLQKKMMIQNTVNIMKKIGWEDINVSVLSAVEKINSKIQSSVDAAQLKEMWRCGEITDCTVEGPIALDLALVKEAALLKNYHSPVAGETDLLIYPDINSGNIGMKAWTMTGHNKTGSVIVGLQCPIVMSSRGASSENKYRSILIAVAIA